LVEEGRRKIQKALGSGTTPTTLEYRHLGEVERGIANSR